MSTIICNSGPLIALGKVSHLFLLGRLYQSVTIPAAVYEEVVTAGLQRGAPEATMIRAFWKRNCWPIVDVPEADMMAWTPSLAIDPGEWQVLTLARALPDTVALIDDLAARKEARTLDVATYGTLGIIVRAVKGGHLDLDVAELLLSEIGSRPDIWISAKLCSQVATALASGRPGDP